MTKGRETRVVTVDAARWGTLTGSLGRRERVLSERADVRAEAERGAALGTLVTLRVVDVRETSGFRTLDTWTAPLHEFAVRGRRALKLARVGSRIEFPSRSARGGRRVGVIVARTATFARVHYAFANGRESEKRVDLRRCRYAR